MSRRIIDYHLNSIPADAARTPGLDNYFDKMVKFVPADVIAAWTSVLGIVKAMGGPSTGIILWWCFIFGLVFTAAWTWRMARGVNRAPAYVQTVVSTVAFAIWAITIGPPFDSLVHPLVGPLALIGFTLASGFIPTNQAP
jgi:hypothetical protein